MLEDHLVWVKFSGVSWYDGGFFYSAYDKPEEGSELSKANEYQKLYYHKLGHHRASDELILNDPQHPKRMFGGGVTNDKRFLFVGMSEGTSGNALTVRDLSRKGSKFVPLMKSFEFDFNAVENIGDDIYVLTNYKAPRYRLIKININHPEEAAWTEVVRRKKMYWNRFD
jgi:prolyl oligopeptidase